MTHKFKIIIIFAWSLIGQDATASQIGSNRYTYDANGNPVLIASTDRRQERRMAWDEENRLLALADNGKSFHYAYDYAGERVLKGKGDGMYVNINGFSPGVGFTGNYTMYVNAYIVVNGPRYTKHFYIEGQRIASKIGNRSIEKEIEQLTAPRAGSSMSSEQQVDYEGKQNISKDALYAAYYAHGAEGVPTAGNSGKTPYGQLKKFFENAGNNVSNGNSGNNGNNGNNGNGNSGNNGNNGNGNNGNSGKIEIGRAHV